ncbi:hypothetical protein BO78DRAFT_399961 [Aspergillus sclerotiicarbonarius CBS 121057]|uniref:Uncharacterized protein n=1 Tax=Aspergillus sclerotiicarbonarius (strain CBS 121057 / IBT 28362) TaxID=1448318 RepID=A0A319DZE6_ASPSB|nr:hypothetical protein BO78DRAFT_399961 [Aspergillus sclerotiicarbonarius CBS 121057]
MASPALNDEVIVALTVTTSSPFMSLSSPVPWKIFVHARILRSSRWGQPVTIVADRSIFWGTGIWRGEFGSAFVSKRDPNRHIRLGHFWVKYIDTFDTLSLYERGFNFLTLPGSGQAVTVTYEVSLEKLFEYSDLRPEDIQSGEEFRFHVNPRQCRVPWWCWGDIEGDLKGKDLHEWSHMEGLADELPPPSQEEIEQGNYITGGDVDKFQVEDQTGWVDVTFMRVRKCRCSALHP